MQCSGGRDRTFGKECRIYREFPSKLSYEPDFVDFFWLFRNGTTCRHREPRWFRTILHKICHSIFLKMWSIEDDSRLVSAMSEWHSLDQWSFVSSRLHNTTPEQCKQRWNNLLFDTSDTSALSIPNVEAQVVKKVVSFKVKIYKTSCFETPKKSVRKRNSANRTFYRFPNALLEKRFHFSFDFP